MRVCVVEYGIGNVQSVVDACGRVGADVTVVRNGEELLGADANRIVLPGVGAIGAALTNLRDRGLDEALETCVRGQGTPFLGICVGMQMLGEVCEEFGEHEGLGWIPGRVRRLCPQESRARLPHVGWNTVNAVNPIDPLLSDVVGKDAYFVHSYVLDCPPEFVISTTGYEEIDFVSAVRNGHIAGVQFHPEKSSAIGASLLSAFLAA